MKKRKGNVAIPLLFASIVFIFISNILFSIFNYNNITKQKSEVYFIDYKLDTSLDISLYQLLNDLTTIQISEPKTPLDNVYSYDVKRAFEVLPLDLLVKNISLKDFVGFKSKTEIISETSLDFTHKENILSFKSGDKVYLNDLIFKIYTNDIEKEYTIKNLYCEIEHSSIDFKMRLNSNEIEIKVKRTR